MHPLHLLPTPMLYRLPYKNVETVYVFCVCTVCGRADTSTTSPQTIILRYVDRLMPPSASRHSAQVRNNMKSICKANDGQRDCHHIPACI